MFNKKVFCSLAGRGLACHIFEENGWKCVRLLMTSLPHLKSLRFCVPFESTTGPRGLGKGLATLPMQPQSISIRLSLGLGSQNAALRPTCWKTTFDPRGVDKGQPVYQHLPPIGGHFCTLPNFTSFSLLKYRMSELCLLSKSFLVFWFFARVHIFKYGFLYFYVYVYLNVCFADLDMFAKTF